MLTLLLVCASTGLTAQGRPEIIRGRVSDGDDHPIADAAIVVTMAPDRTVFQTRTDTLGLYHIRVANGTGDYLFHAAKIGFVPFRRRVVRAGDDSVLIVDARLVSTAQQLPAVRVTSQKPNPTRGPGIGTEAGAAEKIADNFNGALLPESVGDITAIGSLLPSVTPTSGGFAVMGLDPGQNSTTLNGMAFPANSFPRAAETSLRVSTTTFDPARGWFGGANSNLEFRGGGIFSSRQAFATIDAPALQYTDPISARLGQRFTNVNASVGGSGPLDSRDRYFYSYGVQGGRKVAKAASLLTADPELLRHAGASADSIERLVSILRAAGIPASVDGQPVSLLSENGSMLVRFDKSPYDWQALAPSKTTSALTLFGDWARSHPLSLSPTAMPGNTRDSWRMSGTAQALYSTYLRSEYLSTTRTAYSYSVSRITPYLRLPAASVLVASNFDDGTSGVTMLDFGGNGAADQRSDRWTWETTHETQFYAQARGSLHRVTASADARLDGYVDAPGTNALGLFTYSSLGDVALNRPASFTRTLDQPRHAGAEWNAFASIGDLWRVRPNLQVQYGARIEGNKFTSRPAANPEVARIFGVRTDVVPESWHVSPRLGFTWVRRGASNNGAVTFNPMGRFNMSPTSYLRGGIGEFRSLIPATLLSEALVQTGLPGGVSSITCIGDAVPRPDWAAYLDHVNAVPRTCVTASAPDLSQSAPSVRLIDRSYSAPRTWRGNLSFASQYRRLMYSIDGAYSLNIDQPSLTDLNLRRTPVFSVSDEGRPMFVPATAIVPATGMVSRTASRLNADFDRVISAGSGAQSLGRQLIVTVAPDLFQVSSWFVSTSYVLSDTRAFVDGFTSTTGDSPFVRAWSRSPLDVRHQFVVQGGFTLAGLTFTASARAMSGLPFTPVIGSDVNGDGLPNDRAFVFDPARSRDSVFGPAMRGLLDQSTPRTRDCLARQLNRLAASGSCEGPWTASVTAALTAAREVLHLGRISRVQLAFANPLAGIDQLLHGSANLRGWGLRSAPNPVLYEVRGFDPTANGFRYQVNPRFGSTDPALSIARDPFRITIDASINIGRDVALQQLERYLRPGRGRYPGKRLTVDELKRRYERAVPDPYAAILQEADSLLLTRDQVASVQQVQARYRQSMDVLWLGLAEDFASLGDEFDVRAAVSRQEQAIDDGWEISRLSVRTQLPEILSPVQLAVLPSVAARLYRSPGPVRQNGRTVYP